MEGNIKMDLRETGFEDWRWMETSSSAIPVPVGKAPLFITKQINTAWYIITI
jgi:hypothetical protein